MINPFSIWHWLSPGALDRRCRAGRQLIQQVGSMPYPIVMPNLLPTKSQRSRTKRSHGDSSSSKDDTSLASRSVGRLRRAGRSTATRRARSSRRRASRGGGGRSSSRCSRRRDGARAGFCWVGACRDRVAGSGRRGSGSSCSAAGLLTRAGHDVVKVEIRDCGF